MEFRLVWQHVMRPQGMDRSNTTATQKRGLQFLQAVQRTASVAPEIQAHRQTRRRQDRLDLESQRQVVRERVFLLHAAPVLRWMYLEEIGDGVWHCEARAVGSRKVLAKPLPRITHASKGSKFCDAFAVSRLFPTSRSHQTAQKISGNGDCTSSSRHPVAHPKSLKGCRLESFSLNKSACPDTCGWKAGLGVQKLRCGMQDFLGHVRACSSGKEDVD
jgi:hypothetical protein